MPLIDRIEQLVNSFKPIEADVALVQKVMGLIDLTSLNESDSNTSIAAFFGNARTPFGSVAAVCIYPQFVGLAVAEFSNTVIKVATVANFPTGENSIDEVLLEITSALQNGAQEIDVVFPYRRYLAGDKNYAHTFVESCKAACGEQVKLKVILETGAFSDLEMVAAATKAVILAGADFIKTSTGKIAAGPSLKAAAAILLTIHETQSRVGFKVAGGISQVEAAAQYIALAARILGPEWINPNNFRIGTSKLVTEINKWAHA